MAVPDQVPETGDGASAEALKRKYAYEQLPTALWLAVERLNAFLETIPTDDVIKHIHTARTKLVNDDHSPEVTYYSLWTDFADMRVTSDGKLLRSDDYEEKNTDAKNGVDKSHVVPLKEIHTHKDTYNIHHIDSLVKSLTKFLSSKKTS